MKPEDRISLFRKLAPIVYGRYWKTDLPKHLNIGARTVVYWLQGRNPPAVPVVRLLCLCAAHGYVYDRDTKKLKRTRRAKS